MSDELFWLVLISACTSLLWMPYAVVRIRKIGWWRVLMDPLPGDDPFEQAWAHRAYRAHMNAFEALATFAPMAIAVHLAEAATPATAIACATFFWARLLHAPVYIFKVPVFRLLLFMIGLGCTLYLAGHLAVVWVHGSVLPASV